MHLLMSGSEKNYVVDPDGGLCAAVKFILELDFTSIVEYKIYKTFLITFDTFH